MTGNGSGKEGQRKDEVPKRGTDNPKKGELSDLLEGLMTRIQEIREDFTAELDDSEDMIAEFN